MDLFHNAPHGGLKSLQGLRTCDFYTRFQACGHACKHMCGLAACTFAGVPGLICYWLMNDYSCQEAGWSYL